MPAAWSEEDGVSLKIDENDLRAIPEVDLLIELDCVVS